MQLYATCKLSVKYLGTCSVQALHARAGFPLAPASTTSLPSNKALSTNNLIRWLCTRQSPCRSVAFNSVQRTKKGRSLVYSDPLRRQIWSGCDGGLVSPPKVIARREQRNFLQYRWKYLRSEGAKNTYNTSSKNHRNTDVPPDRGNGENGPAAPKLESTEKSNAKKQSSLGKGVASAGAQKHLIDRLPHMPQIQRPGKEELLAAANGFWSRLKIRFKWFSIRSARPFNADEIGAFFSWVLVGHVLWIFLGTTTFFSLAILAVNTVFAQGKCNFTVSGRL